MDSFAGLRVLPRQSGSAFNRPRDTILITDHEANPRHISIYGGKLTSYRAESETVVKLAKQRLPHRKPVADTRKLPLKPA